MHDFDELLHHDTGPSVAVVQLVLRAPLTGKLMSREVAGNCILLLTTVHSFCSSRHELVFLGGHHA